MTVILIKMSPDIQKRIKVIIKGGQGQVKLDHFIRIKLYIYIYILSQNELLGKPL